MERESLAVATVYARIAPDTRASALIRASVAARFSATLSVHDQHTSLAESDAMRG
jgi:hypothetical protein